MTDGPSAAAPDARRSRRLHLLTRHRAQLEALLREHLPDVEVWAYGSRVSGDSHDGSDLDLVLRAPGLEKVPMDPLFDLWEALRESTIPFLVEVRDWARLPESFHGEIERDYVVLVKGAPDCANHADGSTETAATTKPPKRNSGRRRHWKEYAVRELIDTGSLEIGDGYRAKNSELSTSGLPFARAGNIRDGFHFDDADCFPTENLHRVKNKASIPGDVVFTSKGTVGRFAFVRENTPRFVYSPQLCFWRSLDTALIDPRYLFYWMSGPEFFRQFKEVSGQTDMAEFVSLRDQRDMRITLPPVREQRAIARVLGALDDRIELNRRMNATLEAMARALFKSWFVDFDPVRAKMAGRDTSLPEEIADLFPDRLVDSAIGRAPEGWNVGVLNDAVTLLNGGTPRTSVARFWDGDIPWYTAKDAPAPHDVFVLNTERTITRAGVDGSSTIVLPPKTTVITARGTVGRLACLGRAMAMNQTCYGIRGAGGYRDFFVYWLVKRMVEELRTRTHGTIFDTITRQTFTLVGLALPPTSVTNAFEHDVTPIMDRLLANLHQTSAVASLRDTLLPRLVSGEDRDMLALS